MNLKFIFAITLLFFSFLNANAQKTNKDEAALKAVIHEMSEAQLAFNASRLDRILTEDYIEISPIGEFDPRAKVLTFYTPEAKAKNGGVGVDIKEDYRSIRIYGDTAVVIAELSYIMSKGPTLPRRQMMITAICRKERGVWKIASAQYTGVRPAAAKPQ